MSDEGGKGKPRAKGGEGKGGRRNEGKEAHDDGGRRWAREAEENREMAVKCEANMRELRDE